MAPNLTLLVPAVVVIIESDASRVILAASMVRVPLDKSISVPSIVILSIVIPPSTSKTPAQLNVIFDAAASLAPV